MEFFVRFIGTLKKIANSFKTHFWGRIVVLKKRKSIFLVIILGALGLLYFPIKNNYLKTSGSQQVADQRPEINKAKATKIINKDYAFILRNDVGNEAGTLRYSIDSAELRDEIVVKGQKALAVKGKNFLILNVKLINKENAEIAVNTRNYIRLSINENKQEWLAPDMHSDPLKVQPISTKYTRLGFAVDDNVKNFEIQVGEIDKEKNIIDLKFN